MANAGEVILAAVYAIKKDMTMAEFVAIWGPT